MFRKMFISYCLIISFCSIAQAVTDNCRTPNGETAKCVSIRKCPILIQSIQTKNRSAIHFAQKSHCGYAKDPLVCCGTSGNYAKTATDLLPARTYCGYQHSDDYYANRNEGAGQSSIDEFPWLAALIYESDEKSEQILCVGSLINDRYVLTSAHCIRPRQPDLTLTKVRLGEYNIDLKQDCVKDANLNLEECSDPTADFGVEELIVHNDFSMKRHEHDIGLVRLNSTVQYSDYIRPICLPLPGTPRAKVGDLLAESGWGRLTFRGEPALIKKKTTKAILSNDACNRIYGKTYTLKESQMCTRLNSTYFKDTCQGDTGGPSMFNYKNQWSQEGVVSFGGMCGTEFPDVNVKVADYVNWIVDKMVP